MKTDLARFLAATGVLFNLAVTNAAAAVPPRPNVIFILADDFGWRDLGCYGSAFYETPNLDRLAAKGMRFTQGYAACAVCSPTRASILTGKYPARLHLTDWLPGRADSPQQKLNRAPLVGQLPLQELTIAEAFKEAGYRTGFIGKWHLGGPGYYPENQGFDLNIGGNERGMPVTYFSPYRVPSLPDGPAGEYVTDRLTDEALKFIEREKEHPFFLYFSQYAVHIPLEAKPELVAKYRAKAAQLRPSSGPEFLPEGDRVSRQIQNHAIYAAMIESLDQGVGRLLAKLHELGLEENTVIVFTSDNGGLTTAEGSPTSNLPLRAGKGWPYEGGVREPLLVYWPGVTKLGSVCNEPVISTDFYPTLLEITGQKLRPDQHMDGISLVPLLRGEAGAPRPLFWHYPHYSNQGGRPCGAVRWGDYKLVEWFEDMSVELYDLKADPGEHRNLADTNPGKAVELRTLLHSWRESVGAVMTTPNPEYKADALPAGPSSGETHP